MRASIINLTGDSHARCSYISPLSELVLPSGGWTMKVHRVKRLVLVTLGLAVPGALSAQAFGLNEIGSCALGRGFAATASPCKDASTIYWNSAAATQLTGWNITAGAAAIAINGRFTQDTTRRAWDADVPTQIVPHAFLNYRGANSKMAF